MRHIQHLKQQTCNRHMQRRPKRGDKIWEIVNRLLKAIKLPPSSKICLLYMLHKHCRSTTYEQDETNSMQKYDVERELQQIYKDSANKRP